MFERREASVEVERLTTRQEKHGRSLLLQLRPSGAKNQGLVKNVTLG